MCSLPFPLTWKEATSGEAKLLPKLILQRYCHEFKKKLRYLFPVSFSQSRITNDLQQWNVNFKLVHLTFDTISHSSGAWGITKCLGQFQYCSVHATNFLLNLLCIYVRKWTFKAKQNKNINVIALYKALFVYPETKPRGILTANQRTPLYHKEPMRTRSKYKLKSAAKC